MHTFLMFLALGFAPVQPAMAAQLPVPIYAPSTAEDIILAYAIHYGINGKNFLETAQCESGLNAKAINPTDGHGGSRGVFQFQNSTFYSYAPLAGITKPDIWNPMQQVQTAAYMFSIGEQRQWTCYRDIKKSKDSS